MLYAQQKGEAEGRAKGETEVTRTSLTILLSEIGTIPDSLMDRISQETDLDTLKNWLRLAVKSDSINNFLEKIQ